MKRSWANDLRKLGLTSPNRCQQIKCTRSTTPLREGTKIGHFYNLFIMQHASKTSWYLYISVSIIILGYSLWWPNSLHPVNQLPNSSWHPLFSQTEFYGLIFLLFSSHLKTISFSFTVSHRTVGTANLISCSSIKGHVLLPLRWNYSTILWYLKKFR